MELKKNPKADLKKNSAFYYAVGIAAVMFITYLGMNHKTFDKTNYKIAELNLGDLDDEEIPLTSIQRTPPPPPPPEVSDVIEVVEDEEEIEETVIEPTDEIELVEDVVEVSDVDVDEFAEDVDVPFSIIENVPVYPGCERKKNNNERKKCMSKKITQFVNRKFNTGLAQDLGLTGKQKILVMFKIDKTGNIVGVRARAPHPELKKEAERVIRLLPKFKPGMQRGKAVNVPYSLPIVFKVLN